MRDHGGNLDQAIETYGGTAADWIDLSTGINRVPYPVPPLPPSAWTDLPTRRAQSDLASVASAAYATPAAVLAVAGAQAAIQMIPRLGPPGCARVLSPTYNEHAAALRNAGWQVEDVPALDDLAGADLAVIVNPNNPDGRQTSPEGVLALAGRVGRLVVDESFADPCPELSVAPHAGRAGLFVLRSFGKFYGLAGLRLGFILGAPAEIARLSDMAGPWPVCGAAIAIGQAALSDGDWAADTIARLADEAERLDAIASAAGWASVGGTTLFRLYDTDDAAGAQTFLARHHIWSRRFPYSQEWLRLGLPGGADEWARLETALRGAERR
ncbi:threonine-phosphate decarboxylase CobD [Defluviimonas sp. WL0002]|uniref:threonine-phosphate decarboxylase n=1 Tax=Albidovulum marisflavi TaxID=2984159 RepID=A0ABT2Z9I4_9RHOB|nr:threonine-phosphate decarboxylase CobD [Defluviimonas sp. WL0002]MCV2867756.1 threonine-phosphate decarboxylase CobD [Defluviimonas sp. WL0002]